MVNRSVNDDSMLWLTYRGCQSQTRFRDCPKRFFMQALYRPMQRKILCTLPYRPCTVSTIC